MSVKIYCPNCGRILGDTDREIDSLRLNCRGCKKTVDIKVKIQSHKDYYRKEHNGDKSK